MTRYSSNEASNTWYLDSYISKHICNNKELFSNIWSKNYEFITIEGIIIYFQVVGIVHLLLQSGKTTMTLLNIINAPKCDFNLILLGQFRKSGILYHNYPDSIILRQRKSTLGVANKHKSIFVIKTDSKAKAMLVKEKDRSIYLLSKNLQIRLWH